MMYLMNCYSIFYVLIVVASLSLILYLVIFLYKSPTVSIHHTKTPIYCLMITGKSELRLPWARASLQNFLEQTYSNKHLIIINHGNERVYEQHGKSIDSESHINEYMVEKGKGVTLGDLRNDALSHVPIGEIWTTWDDDDIRCNDYLEQLYNEMTVNNVQCVMIRNRFEYNMNTKKIWASSLHTGFLWFFMRKQAHDFVYDKKETNEDGLLKIQILTEGESFYKIYDNNPICYIRLIHNDNTSMYVDKTQTGPKEKYTEGKRLYSERDITEDEKKIISNRIKQFY